MFNLVEGLGTKAVRPTQNIIAGAISRVAISVGCCSRVPARTQHPPRPGPCRGGPFPFAFRLSPLPAARSCTSFTSQTMTLLTRPIQHYIKTPSPVPSLHLLSQVRMSLCVKACGEDLWLCPLATRRESALTRCSLAACPPWARPKTGTCKQSQYKDNAASGSSWFP